MIDIETCHNICDFWYTVKLIISRKNDLFVSFSWKNIFSESRQRIFVILSRFFVVRFLFYQIIIKCRDGLFVIEELFIFGIMGRKQFNRFILIEIVAFPWNSLWDLDHFVQKFSWNVITRVHINRFCHYIESAQQIIKVFIVQFAVKRRHVQDLVVKLLNEVERIR